MSSFDRNIPSDKLMDLRPRMESEEDGIIGGRERAPRRARNTKSDANSIRGEYGYRRRRCRKTNYDGWSVRAHSSPRSDIELKWRVSAFSIWYEHAVKAGASLVHYGRRTHNGAFVYAHAQSRESLFQVGRVLGCEHSLIEKFDIKTEQSLHCTLT